MGRERVDRVRIALDKLVMKIPTEQVRISDGGRLDIPNRVFACSIGCRNYRCIFGIMAYYSLTMGHLQLNWLPACIRGNHKEDIPENLIWKKGIDELSDEEYSKFIPYLEKLYDPVWQKRVMADSIREKSREFVKNKRRL